MNQIVIFVAQYALAVPALCVVAAILMRRQWKYDLIDAVVGAVDVAVLETLAGALRHETRPFVALHLTPLVAHVGDNSFPSDHMAATGLAVMYLWPRSRPLALVALAVGALLGAARVLAHLHWPLDIAVGFAIGVIGMLLGHVQVRKLFSKQTAERIGG